MSARQSQQPKPKKLMGRPKGSKTKNQQRYLRIPDVDWMRMRVFQSGKIPRTTPWIRLYSVDHMQDMQFLGLDDATRWHVIGIRLMAIASNNAIPWEPEYIASRVSKSGEVDFERLISLGYIEITAKKALRKITQREFVMQVAEGLRRLNSTGIDIEPEHITEEARKVLGELTAANN